MTHVDLHDFKILYCQTAQEYISGMKKDAEVLSRDVTNKEKAADLFMKAHSLKSQSLVMGYTGIGNLSKAIELLFREIKEDKRLNSISVMGTVQKAIVSMQESLQEIIATGIEGDMTMQLQALAAIEEHI